MNLVQTQYHLRDLPDSEIKAFADGKDPATVPEWLAASEMQRRQRLEMASNKAPQKSVKERLEETMGLKALQAQRQQQASQQMGEQAMAAPTIPENVPQPVEQPEVEAAAGGLMRGIAQLPVEMFHQAAYAGGGIVAFEGGGDVDNAKKWAELSLGPNGVASPAYQELLNTLRKPEEEIEKPEDIIAKRKALLEQQGVRPIGEGQERRIQERNAAYEQEKKDRAFNNLIASMSAFGRPNITGKGQASDYAGTAVKGFEAGRAEDRQFQEAQDKLQDALETQRRAELVGNVDMAQKAVEDQKKARAEMARAKLTAMGQGAQTEATKASAGLGYLESLNRNKLQAEANKIQLAQLSKDPDAIRGAEALRRDAQKAGKELSLQDALLIWGQSQAGYLGRAESADVKRTADADKAFKDAYGTKIQMAEFEKDPAKKQKLLDELAAAKKRIYKEHKVGMGEDSSSDSGASTSGWGKAEKVK